MRGLDALSTHNKRTLLESTMAFRSDKPKVCLIAQTRMVFGERCRGIVKRVTYSAEVRYILWLRRLSKID